MNTADPFYIVHYAFLSHSLRKLSTGLATAAWMLWVETVRRANVPDAATTHHEKAMRVAKVLSHAFIIPHASGTDTTTAIPTSRTVRCETSHATLNILTYVTHTMARLGLAGTIRLLIEGRHERRHNLFKLTQVRPSHSYVLLPLLLSKCSAKKQNVVSEPETAFYD